MGQSTAAAFKPCDQRHYNGCYCLSFDVGGESTHSVVSAGCEIDIVIQSGSCVDLRENAHNLSYRLQEGTSQKSLTTWKAYNGFLM